MVILFRDCILSCKPEILLCLKRKIKAASCKALDRIVEIMHSLKNSCALKVMNKLSCLFTSLISKYKLCLTSLRNLHLRCLIHITIRMSCNCDRLLPCLNIWLNTLNDNRSSEYCTIKHGSYCSIRALIHLFKVIFCHSCCIRCNCCTLYCNTILLSSFC